MGAIPQRSSFQENEVKAPKPVGVDGDFCFLTFRSVGCTQPAQQGPSQDRHSPTCPGPDTQGLTWTQIFKAISISPRWKVHSQQPQQGLFL